jgi:hypothetical protein
MSAGDLPRWIGWHNIGRMRGCHRRSLTIATEHRQPMITLINKLISLLPNQRDEVYQTHWMFHHGIDPVPSWTVNWLYELLTFFHGRSR